VAPTIYFDEKTTIERIEAKTKGVRRKEDIIMKEEVGREEIKNVLGDNTAKLCHASLRV
jgi:hypothetical protein